MRNLVSANQPHKIKTHVSVQADVLLVSKRHISATHSLPNEQTFGYISLQLVYKAMADKISSHWFCHVKNHLLSEWDWLVGRNTLTFAICMAKPKQTSSENMSMLEIPEDLHKFIGWRVGMQKHIKNSAVTGWAPG